MKAVNALQVIMQGVDKEFDARMVKRFGIHALELAAAGKSPL